MQLKVFFDDDLLIQYAKRGKSVLFGIAWHHSDFCYPDADWTDFGVTILGWWSSNIIQLLNGADECHLLFMDGPYAIKLQYDAEVGFVTCTPKGLDQIWQVSLEQLIHEVQLAISTVLTKLEQLGIAEYDTKSLRISLAALKPFD